MLPISSWRKELFTLPNILSLIRLFLIPVYVYMYSRAQSCLDYILSGCVLAVSCLTDMIDGRIARKYNMITRTGMILDPIADKCTQLVLTIILSMKYPVMYAVLTLFVAKECFQLIAGLLAFRKGMMLTGALFVGKLCTTILFISFITMIVFPHVPDSVVSFLSMTDCVFLLVSFIGYVQAYIGKNKKTEYMKQ